MWGCMYFSIMGLKSNNTSKILICEWLQPMKKLRRKQRRISRRGAGWIVVLILVAAVLAFVIGNAIESNGESTEKGRVGNRFDDVTLVYKGTKYRYRKNEITTVLFMGIDTEAEGDQVGVGFRNGGQSDFLLLMLIDSGRKQIIPLQIDRDTMAEITILGAFGNYAGTNYAQICLSHGFGDGGAQSCEFTVRAVSTLLYGVDIDFYVAMNLDSIPVLNDALGGVTVTLKDDFTQYDPQMAEGTTLTLQGKQAEYYVRGRRDIGEQTNASRMVRQREYMNELATLLDVRERSDKNYVGKLFDILEPYLHTNMRRGRMINEAWKARDYERMDTVSPAGSHTTGSSGFIEFYADQEALEELVLELFYEPV